MFHLVQGRLIPHYGWETNQTPYGEAHFTLFGPNMKARSCSLAPCGLDTLTRLSDSEVIIVTQWWDAGVVMCLGQGADLHKTQLMPLPLTISCYSKSRLVLPPWFYLSGAGSPE